MTTTSASGARTRRRSRAAVWWWEITYRIGPNLWVVPLLMAVGSIGVFVVTRRLDRVVGPPAPDASTIWPEWLIARTPADADVVLSAFLGALAAALALVFSTTVLTFSLASSQLGPRLIRRFMQDPVTQVTLGMFLSAVLLCALTLGSVRNGAGPSGVPVVSYGVTVLAGLSCFVLLVVYIHRVAVTIQAPNVVASVVGALDRSLDERDRRHADLLESADEEGVGRTVEELLDDGGVIAATASGYVQVVDHLRLLDLADEHGAVIALDRRVGQFVVAGRPLVRVLPASATGVVEAELHQAIEIGPTRTRRQDTEFAVYQVVEIAIRALSPAVNDTFTGRTCVDWLGASLARIGAEPDRTGGYLGRDGRVHLHIPPLRFERLVRAAFDMVRESGADNPAIVIRLLEVIATTAESVRPEFLPALEAEADQVLASSIAAGTTGRDAAEVADGHRRTVERIDARRRGA